MFKLLFWICKDTNNILNTNELHLLFFLIKLCLTICLSTSYHSIPWQMPGRKRNFASPFIFAMNDDVCILTFLVKLVQIIVWLNAFPKHLRSRLRLIITSSAHTFGIIWICFSRFQHWCRYRVADKTRHCQKDTRGQSSTFSVLLW